MYHSRDPVLPRVYPRIYLRPTHAQPPPSDRTSRLARRTAQTQTPPEWLLAMRMTAGNPDAIIDPNQAQREAVRHGIAQCQQRLLAAGHNFRGPPPEPTTCCGRGCNGCVWESYEAALMGWHEEVGALLT